MPVTYTALATSLTLGPYELQPGMILEDTPEGLGTLVAKYKGKASDAATFFNGVERGDACAVAGFTSYLAVSRPRMEFQGAWATGTVVYQEPSAGSGGSDDAADINLSTESAFVTIAPGFADFKAWNVRYLAPTATASYVKAAKPTSFAYESLLGSEDIPPIDEADIERVGGATGLPVQDVNYRIAVVSKWGSRRNSGGVWHVTEIHQKVIQNIVSE